MALFNEPTHRMHRIKVPPEGLDNQILLPFGIHPDRGVLSVYLNGMRLWEGEHWSRISPEMIQLDPSITLAEGDGLEFVWEVIW